MCLKDDCWRALYERGCRDWIERPPESTDNDETFDVTDEAGDIVLEVPFSEAFAERAVT